MPAFRTMNVEGRLAVVFLDDGFAAAFRALAYAWDGERSPDLLPDIIRECRKWEKLGDRAEIATAAG